MMLLSLRSDHKDHLVFLTSQSSQVVIDFCKLAIDYLQFGPNLKLYNTAAQKLAVESQVVENAVYGLINLLLESCKHKLSNTDFRDSVLSLGFQEDLQVILNKFYESKKNDISEILSRFSPKVPHYYDLEWRLEVQVSSRCLLQQVTPLITLNLCTELQPDIKSSNNEDSKTNIILQTDPVNLVHMTQILEEALNESRSRHNRRIQKMFQ